MEVCAALGVFDAQLAAQLAHETEHDLHSGAAGLIWIEIDWHDSAVVVHWQAQLPRGRGRIGFTHRTPSRESVSQGLDRVRERAKSQKKERFTALLHHVDVDRLRRAYFALKRAASPGIDGMTWQQYGESLEANLNDLHGRIHCGAYRALPSRRQYIPKADGRQRPLGIAALEDKIAQRAVLEVLNAIYEVNFSGIQLRVQTEAQPA